MRFMVIMKVNEESEAGVLPTSADIDTMGGFIEKLVGAGVLIAADGLLPSSTGARIHFDGGRVTDVTDGPFAETKELIGGYFMVDLPSLEECVEWFRQCPVRHTTNIEIRRVVQPEDFAEVMTPEQQAAVEQREARAAAQR